MVSLTPRSYTLLIEDMVRHEIVFWNVSETVIVWGYTTYLRLGLIPRLSVQKSRRGPSWYLFSREWCQNRKEGRKGFIVRGCTGPRIAKTAKLPYHVYLASGRWLSYTPSTEHVVGQTICKTQPVSLANFCHFPITSCLHEKRYPALPAFLYCKRQKAGRGLGTRLPESHCNYVLVSFRGYSQILSRSRVEKSGTNTTSWTRNGGLDYYVMWTWFHNDDNAPTQYAASTASDRAVKFA